MSPARDLVGYGTRRSMQEDTDRDIGFSGRDWGDPWASTRQWAQDKGIGSWMSDVGRSIFGGGQAAAPTTPQGASAPRGALRVGGLRDSRDVAPVTEGMYWDQRYRVPVTQGSSIDLAALFDEAQRSGQDFRYLYQNRMAGDPRYADMVREMNRGTPALGGAAYATPEWAGYATARRPVAAYASDPYGGG